MVLGSNEIRFHHLHHRCHLRLESYHNLSDQSLEQATLLLPYLYTPVFPDDHIRTQIGNESIRTEERVTSPCLSVHGWHDTVSIHSAVTDLASRPLKSQDVHLLYALGKPVTFQSSFGFTRIHIAQICMRVT